MKNSLRKSLITVLCSVLAILFVVVIASSVNFAKADEYATDLPSGTISEVAEEDASKFYVKGAGVRTVDNIGIKFETIITKDYVQYLESLGSVEFIATAQAESGAPQAVKFKYTPTAATMGDSFTLKTYLNFGEFDGDLATASATEFIIETYAKITNGSEVSYVKAYKPEGDDVARSMRAVANMASITGTEGLEQYYGERVDIHKGYGVFVANTGIDNVNNLEVSAFKDFAIADGTVDLYVDAAKYTCSVADGRIILPQLKNLNANNYKYVTIFNSGKAYTTKVDICTDVIKVTAADTDIFKTISDEYVVLTESVSLPDMDGYANTGYFKGVFDGYGYNLDVYRVRAANSVFNICDGTIKNFKMLTYLTDPGGIVVKNAEDGLVIMNAFIRTGNMRNDSGEIGLIRGLEKIIRDDSSVAIQTAIIEDVSLWFYEVADSADADSDRKVVSGKYIAGSNSNGDVIINNCNFFGSRGVNGKIFSLGVANNVAEDSTYTIHTNSFTFFESVVANSRQRAFVEDAYTSSTYEANYTTQAKFLESADRIYQTYGNESVLNYIRFVKNKGVIDTTNCLWQDNITDFSSATSGTWYLVSDVDMSKVASWTAPTLSSGTFDGRNRAIKNFKPVAGKTGSFISRIAGTVQNVAFTDVDLSKGAAGGCGLIFHGTVNTTIQNVFVEITSSARGRGTGIFGDAYGNITLRFINVFVYDASQTGSVYNGILTGRNEQTGVVYLTSNCHFVVLNPSALNPQDDGLVGENASGGYKRPDFTNAIKDTGYFMYANLDAVDASNNAKLTDFMKSCISKYL